MISGRLMPFITAAALILSLAGCSGLNEELGKVLEAGGGQGGALDEETVAAGIKEALRVGAEKTVESTSRKGGFLENRLIRIAIPEQLDIHPVSGFPGGYFVGQLFGIFNLNSVETDNDIPLFDLSFVGGAFIHNPADHYTPVMFVALFLDHFLSEIGHEDTEKCFLPAGFLFASRR